MQAGQVGTRIDSALPPERRRCARLLVSLYKRVGTATLKDASALLGSRGLTASECEISYISRCLNGNRVPSTQFVNQLYKLAAERANGLPLDVSFQDALSIHQQAQMRMCRSCVRLRRMNHSLRGEVKRLRRSRAGLKSVPQTIELPATPLPVPLEEGDRQRRAKDVAVAMQLAIRAQELHDHDERDAAVGLLGDTAEVLTPAESAAAIVLLRGQHQDRLAEALIRMYGRDQSEKDVMRVAIELHEYGRSDDAGAILRAAVS